MKNQSLLYILIALCTMVLNITNVKAQWTSLTSGTTAKLYSVHFSDANNGYAVGNGMRRWTTTAGSSWVGVGSSYDIYYSAFFTSTDTGYIVGGTNYPFMGNYGVVKKSTSGGYGFGSTIYTIDTLMSVHFTSSSIGYATGPNGLILKTIDGGNNWSPLSSGITNDLWSIYFPDANTGYIAGLSGTILKTINGGTTWTPQTSGTSVDLYSIYFTDVNTGYAVGNNGTILKTINGGTNWIAQISGTTVNLRSIYFPDINIGYIAGFSGKILKTSNAGINWTVQVSGTSLDLYSIYFTDVNTGYAVGNSGKILKTINGGAVSIDEIELLESSINIYPNPTKATIQIESADLQIKSLEIYNMQSQLVKHITILNSKTPNEIDVSMLPNGVYLVKVQTENGVANKKLIIQ